MIAETSHSNASMHLPGRPREGMILVKSKMHLHEEREYETGD
jgi:hypothetical protein